MTVASRNEGLLELRERYVPRGVGSAHPVFIAKAQGAKVWDVDSREYIDFTSGIGVLNVGHSHPKVIRAVQAQLERFTHVCFQVAPYEPYVRLTEKLSDLTKQMGATETLLLTTGAEATENAIKIARAHTKRPAVISFGGGFHGRTMLALSMTGKTQPYKQNFGPFAPEVYQTVFPYEYRSWTTERALAALAETFKLQVDPGNVAAIIVEPVQGEGGFIPAPVEFFRELRRTTEENGILLVADEVQTGFGRTGKMFAFEHADVAPDMITVAKSLAGGLPLSAVIGRSEVMNAPEPGGLGGTYGGNPLACAAALAVLDVFEEEGLLEKAERLGQHLRDGLLKLQGRFPEIIGDVRGLGVMQAIELVRDPDTKEPAVQLTQRVVEEARERGLLLLKAGTYNNVIRFLSPLTMDLETLDVGLKRLETACEASFGGKQ
jgi:4-aminobutyrate aminotransferase/(S)-3-amino-2-methylpropionate transaminase